MDRLFQFLFHTGGERQWSAAQAKQLCSIHGVISALVRSFSSDVMQQTVTVQNPLLLSVFVEVEPLPSSITDLFLKDDCYLSEVMTSALENTDALSVLKYFCWGNPDYSTKLVLRLLHDLGHARIDGVTEACHALKSVLLLEDGFQDLRSKLLLYGITDAEAVPGHPAERGLVALLAPPRHNSRRIYMYIWLVVELLSVNLVSQFVQEQRTTWSETVRWLESNIIVRTPYVNSYPYVAPDSNTLQRTLSIQRTIDGAIEAVRQAD